METKKKKKEAEMFLRRSGSGVKGAFLSDNLKCKMFVFLATAFAQWC